MDPSVVKLSSKIVSVTGGRVGGVGSTLPLVFQNLEILWEGH